MAKFGKTPGMPTLDLGEGAPTMGQSKAKTTLSDGTVRGRPIAPKGRPPFGGGGKLKMAKAKTGPKKAAKPPGGGGTRPGFSLPPGPRGAGNMAADTKKYGAMMKGRA